MMKKSILSLLFLFILAPCVFAQMPEARLIDQFGRIPCGDFMARMDSLFQEFKKSPESKIYVIHYGGRYRKEFSKWNRETRKYEKIKLKKPHREDGLNLAKSIPIYLAFEPFYGAAARIMREKIVLADGGFRENPEVSVWLVPPAARAPQPTPTVAAENIKFRKDKPYRVQDFTKCYSDE